MSEASTAESSSTSAQFDFGNNDSNKQVINKNMEPHKAEQNGTNGVASLAGLIPGFVTPSLVQQQLVFSGTQRKDCVRLRGLPYEAQVHHILDFLGDFTRFIVYQGVHLVYNSQGHPSGEAFIQMDDDQHAAATAMDRHNKYMSIGKKQRYIEVFQCSADDMSLVVTGPTAPTQLFPNSFTAPSVAALPRLPLSPDFAVTNAVNLFGGQHIPGLTSPGTPTFTASLNGTPQSMLSPQQLITSNTQHLHNGQVRLPMIPVTSMNGGGMVPSVASNGSLTSTSTPVTPVLYPYVWPYPSPPMSPTNAVYYAALNQQQQQQQQVAAAVAQQQQLIQQQQQQLALQQQAALQQANFIPQTAAPPPTAVSQGPTLVLMRQVPFNASTTDLLQFFQGYGEVTAECIQIQRNVTGQPTGDVLVTFTSRDDALRAIADKNHSIFMQRQIEMYLYATL